MRACTALGRSLARACDAWKTSPLRKAQARGTRTGAEHGDPRQRDAQRSRKGAGRAADRRSRGQAAAVARGPGQGAARVSPVLAQGCGRRLSPARPPSQAPSPRSAPSFRSVLSTCIQTATRDSTHAAERRTKPHASTGRCWDGAGACPSGRDLGVPSHSCFGAEGAHKARADPGEITPHTQKLNLQKQHPGAPGKQD